MLNNIMLLTDSYKQSHWKQYPANTETVYSYLESRGGQWGETTFFGLQYFLKRYLEGEVVTQKKINSAEAIIDAHMGPGTFNREGWEYILKNYNGRLPVKIRAIPEGTTVPGRNVLMTIENTDPHCYWLTNFLETLLVETWYPITVCTQSREMKKIILANLIKTGTPEDYPFKLHDFGYRGVSSPETAAIGGAAHLVNFKGTDTIAGLEALMEYYGAVEVPGISIPASEHSTMTSWGKEHEAEAMENMLDAYPTGPVACVSDSFDIFHACGEIWGKQLKEKILQRDGFLVVRPDSGYPPTVVSEVLKILAKSFGCTKNAKGYNVLNPKVRVIQGDGIDIDMINSILLQMEFGGWSGDNIAFGSGGGLLQKLNRDTLKFAFKCSAIQRGGRWYDVYKDPITDKGKASKRGRLKLVKTNGKYVTQTIPEDRGDFITVDAEPLDELETVFYNGHLIVNHKLEDIRKRAEINVDETSI